VTSDLASVSTSPVSGGATGGPGPRSGRWRAALRWEAALVLVLVAVVLFGAAESSTFLTPTTFFYLGTDIGYIAIMALPMTLIVMTGEIDLSVASALGLSGAVVGFLWHHGWGIWPAVLVALAVGALGGAINGVLVAKVGLPSIAVTIGTLTLYRGLAEVLLGSLTVPAVGDRPFPTSLTNIGVVPVPGTHMSYSLLFFLILAVVFGILLHATPLGRSLVAIGLQPEAARFVGIRVNRIKLVLYIVSGVMCAFAGILLTLQNASVSYNAGYGLELNVVAIVLFGGVSIFGGRGSILGVVLSVAIVGALEMALTQMNVDPNVQNIVTGVLLLLSVIIPNGGELVRRVRARMRRLTPGS
jgi:rhamnose transport system permease protein